MPLTTSLYSILSFAWTIFYFHFSILVPVFSRTLPLPSPSPSSSRYVVGLSCHSLTNIETKWASAPRRSESPESTEPDMGPPCVSLCARSRSASTPPTVVHSAARTLSSAPVLGSGTASPAERSWLEEPTPSPQPPPSLFAVPLAV